MMTMPSTTSTTPVARFRSWGSLVGKHGRNAGPQQGEHHTQHPDAPVRRTADHEVGDCTGEGGEVMMNTLVPTAVLSS